MADIQINTSVTKDSKLTVDELRAFVEAIAAVPGDRELNVSVYQGGQRDEGAYTITFSVSAPPTPVSSTTTAPHFHHPKPGQRGVDTGTGLDKAWTGQRD